MEEVTTISAELQGGYVRCRYRGNDAEPFRPLLLDGEERVRWRPGLWDSIRFVLQLDYAQHPLRVLLGTDTALSRDDVLPPAQGCPWTRKLLREAASFWSAAGSWTLNETAIPPGSFSDVFPVCAGKQARYAYSIPDYHIPALSAPTYSTGQRDTENTAKPNKPPCRQSSHASYDAAFVLAGLLRDEETGSVQQQTGEPQPPQTQYRLLETLRALLEEP